MKSLFHVSEDSSIDRFEPRMPPTENPVVNAPVVWAVAETHLTNYLLPRECPRVAFQRAPETSELDAERFLGSSGATRVLAIEAPWFERATSCTLWLYEVSSASFTCSDTNAGYFVSTVAVVPISRRRLDRPLAAILEAGVELHVLQSLLGLAAAVSSSSLAFSCIRMRNVGANPNAA
jgi:hypothetical protein